MSVFLRNGKFVISYYPHGRKGKHVRIQLPEGTTDEEARKVERSLREKKRATPPASATDSIRQLQAPYFRHIEPRQSPRTVDDKRECFEKHIIPYFGGFRVQELTSSIQAGYQEWRLKQYAEMKDEDKRKHQIKDGHRSINKELAYLGGMLKWARKYLHARPAEQLYREDLPYKRPIPKVWSRADLDKLIAAVEAGFYRTFVLVLFHLGLRKQSARTLRWEQLDLHGRAEDSSIVIIGKGNKENRLPLGLDLHAGLMELHAERMHLPEKERSPWVFPSPRDRRKPIYDVRKPLDRALKISKIRKRINHHLMRHSLATYLIEQGNDLRTVQEILGHADVITTQWYTQVALELKRTAFSRAGLGSKPASSKHTEHRPSSPDNLPR